MAKSIENLPASGSALWSARLLYLEGAIEQEQVGTTAQTGVRAITAAEHIVQAAVLRHVEQQWQQCTHRTWLQEGIQ